MSDSADHVIVVGAGIIGMACAHYLSAAGLNVTLIDKGEPGQACSQSNCGYVCPSHVLPLNSMGALKKGMRSLLNPSAPFRLKLQWRAGLYRWLYEFARRCGEHAMVEAGHQLQPLLASSRAAYQQLMSTEEFDCGWRESGLLYVFQSVEAFDDYAQED
ncbi:MAG: FAD-dependent oxidoreductase, partial [Pseudomonadota bacterium]